MVFFGESLKHIIFQVCFYHTYATSICILIYYFNYIYWMAWLNLYCPLYWQKPNTNNSHQVCSKTIYDCLRNNFPKWISSSYICDKNTALGGHTDFLFYLECVCGSIIQCSKYLFWFVYTHYSHSSLSV